ncbi:ABC transporter family substrate-binding protein [Streptomyces sp. DSM 44915]|uniref:ABC transporter family substrate-binding protein n=1 Tax=Streptomyces chisholmiae TaxID=3075540 RepID=A0ABU2JYN4_9ACTN|nr:ABC transporter family substrate-binding protein [Streptomyces sp. DSM 44915]MDT0270120.1 ABC transporter family substrate-binding protein [Streptomyces sp. DSM 44915]
MSKIVAAALGGTLVLSACGGGGDDDDNDDSNASGGGNTVTYGMAQPWDSYNQTTAGANSVANGQVMHQVVGGFWRFGNEDGQPIPNEDFGTFEQTSEDPLTVEYNIHEEAVWSDGTPIDCDDIMMWWTSNSGNFDGLFSSPGTQGIEDTAMPDCAPGEKSFTLVYDQPYADWLTAGPGGGNTAMMPAHVVAEQGGFASPEEFLTALQGDDPAPLEEAAAFFNEGWLINNELPDPALIPASGPYVITDYTANQSVTLSRNEAYWGEPAAADSIVIRFVAEPEQVQALQNGEVDIIEPQPTVDMAEQIAAASGLESEVAEEYTYEHLDFNFNDGPFADSLELRQAFALCVPYQTLIDNLIAPVVPDATVKQVRNVAPWDAGYQEAVDASAETLETYGVTDIERSRQMLEELDAVGTPVVLGTLENQRRNDAGLLIQSSCNEAGFEVDFQPAADFFDTTGALSEGRFDVAMYAWSGSPDRSGWNSTYRTVGECTADGKGNNNGCYSNEELDQLLDDVLRTGVLEEAVDITAQIEAHLWENMVTIPLYQHPGITAWNSQVSNVIPNPSQNGIVWNAQTWSKS